MEKLNLLNLLYENEKIIIPKLSGNKTIYESKVPFSFYLDYNFKDWGLNKKSRRTSEIEVKVYEAIKNATFKEMFTSLSNNLDSLCLTQHQIINFCFKYFQYLRRDGYATLFLLKKKNLFRKDEFFVVSVGVGSGGLSVYVDHFDDTYVWDANCRRRLVLPKAD